MSDEAVEAKTGKTWSRWFKHLDAAGARKMTHQEIVAHLRDKHDVRPWWQQMVAVTYEQARGLREIHEKPSGYEISVSRTITASISQTFRRGLMRRRENNGCRRTSRSQIHCEQNHSHHMERWHGSRSRFLSKDEAKSQVVAQHGKLKDAKAGAKMKRSGLTHSDD
jgi:hypothetical protein